MRLIKMKHPYRGMISVIRQREQVQVVMFSDVNKGRMDALTVSMI